MAPTPKYGLPVPGTGSPADVPADLNALALAIENIIATDDQGPIASRPVSTPGSPGKEGRYWYATDTKTLSRDFGTGWYDINAWQPSGFGGRDAGQTVSGTAYTNPANPDVVTGVVVPDKALVEIVYFGVINVTSVDNNGKAAIFIGSNQMKKWTVNGFVNQEATTAGTGGASTGRKRVTSFTGGLISEGTIAVPAVPVSPNVPAHVIGSASTTIPEDGGGHSGACKIHVPAGTYDIAVKYAVGGLGLSSITVESRHLYVRVIPYVQP